MSAASSLKGEQGSVRNNGAAEFLHTFADTKNLRRPSIRRIVRQIKKHKHAIGQHCAALVALRIELEEVEAYVEGAHRSLQDAINELSHVE